MAEGAGDNNSRSDDIVHLALNDPVPAIAEADSILAAPSFSESEHITALRARGLARRRLGQFEESAADLNQALDRAEVLGDDELWAGAGLSMAGTLVFQGRIDDAKQLLRRCISRSSGDTHAEAIYQLGTTHAQAFEFDDALAHYDRALPLMRALDRPAWEGDLLGNRGVINIYQGNYDDAIADLDAALELQVDQGPALYSLQRDNKAYALQLRGDIAEAIDLYETNEAFKAEHDLPSAMYPRRCMAYLAAGMYEDAMAMAQQAHRFHTDGQAVLGAIEALVPGAEAALALGDQELTRQLADAAINLDTERSFPALTARAELTKLEARLRTSDTSPDDLATIETLFLALKEGEVATAARALLIGASIALLAERRPEAAQLTQRARPLTQRSPPHVRIEQCVLTSQLSTTDEEVLASVDAGLTTYNELVSGVANYDVRYKSARFAEQLSAIGIDVLLKAGDAPRAVEMVEAVRAGSLRLDDRSDRELDDLLRAAETYLVWVEHEERLSCIAARSDNTTIHSCGERSAIDRLVAKHRFAHRQLAHRAGLSEAARAELKSAAETADRDLEAVLVPTDVEGRVMLNPPGALASVLWGALPRLGACEFTVAPSRQVARRPLPTRIERVAVLGASELAHVPPEIAAIAAGWSVDDELDPDASVFGRLEGLDLLHIASHFASDGSNPLFSAMPLGPTRLRGHEYLQLAPPPTIAVLSSCASGRGRDVAGAQVGFSSAALAAGTSAVIVTQTIVEDGPTIASAMTQLHAALRAGCGPAAALLQVRRSAVDDDRSAAGSLIVLGAGW